ncbi:pirin family protein [Botrimarina sp.]|uniref:pirin family protein n=1 Tax=Botrimarina sp. TaxID=2795802 RepID=UPI0032EB505B
MLTLRPAAERGHADHGWLRSAHTFSFAGYHDPAHMGYRSLRVVNDDRVAPGQGFGSHPHRDMEILSYVVEGRLEHRDSLGHGAVIGPGDFQRITAGTGVVHSEFNPSDDEPVHFYQVWITPRATGLPPGYEELRADTLAANPAPLRLVASPDGRDGSLTIQQDALVWLARLADEQSERYSLRPGRGLWVQAVRGAAVVAGRPLTEGDGLAVEDLSEVEFAGGQSGGGELLLFDLP